MTTLVISLLCFALGFFISDVIHLVRASLVVDEFLNIK
jgi:hypothetical protein